MPTTTVPKGTNRPAAAARSNRHAQRTPLPPRPGQVEAAREVIIGRPMEYGRMTVPKLRERAEALGLTPPKSATKGKLLEAILVAERELKARSEEWSQKAHAELEGLPSLQEVRQAVMARQITPEPKGQAKALRLAEEAGRSGWAAEITATAPEGRTIATLTRASEQIVIVWDSGVFNYDESRHVIGDRTVKPRNVSQARSWAARPVEAAQAELAKVVSNKWRRKPATAPVRRPLPFDPEVATDEEVLKAVTGRKITWYNRLSGETETAIVPAVSPWTRLQENAEAGRVLWFCSPGSGFRACRVAAILAVGRGK